MTYIFLYILIYCKKWKMDGFDESEEGGGGFSTLTCFSGEQG